jgi:rare lipoprotein A
MKPLVVASLSLVLSLGAAPMQGADERGQNPSSPQRIEATPKKLDYSGKRRFGKASFYARRFAGQTMADGTPMDPKDDNAASTTLPLGTTAKVTNLQTGRSAVVTIQDRGPYIVGRIVDLSPSTAREIGLTAKDGLADVKVEPIAVPMPDGSIMLGAGAGAGAVAKGG